MALDLELRPIPVCATCGCSFLAHYMLSCDKCHNHICCQCIHKDRELCRCDGLMSRVETSITYRIQNHSCDSKYQTDSPTTPPYSDAERLANMLVTKELSPVQATLVLDRLISIAKRVPFFPPKVLRKGITRLEAPLLENLSKAPLMENSDVPSILPLLELSREVDKAKPKSSHRLVQCFYAMSLMCMVALVVVSIVFVNKI